MEGGTVAVIGHRGARGLFPENTLEGFQSAFRLGVRAFELDVGLTQDGVVVVSHDPALNPDITRDASGAWLDGRGPLIHGLTVSALAAYDVGRIRPGSPTDRLFPDQMPCDGARVPTLAAVLGGLPEAHFIIEVKTDPTHPAWTADPRVLVEALLAVVGQMNASARVVIESFDWRVQRHLRAARPDLRLAWLTRGAEFADPWWDGMRAADQGGSVPACVAAASGGAPGASWAPHHQEVTEALVAEAHALGLGVLPWTVNDPKDMQRLIGWGVDGIISDRPDVLARVVGEAGNAARPLS